MVVARRDIAPTGGPKHPLRRPVRQSAAADLAIHNFGEWRWGTDFLRFDADDSQMPRTLLPLGLTAHSVSRPTPLLTRCANTEHVASP